MKMMNKEDLEKRIIELELLVSQKDKIINILEEELSFERQKTRHPSPFEPYKSPFAPNIYDDNACPAGGVHDYPSPWNGVIPPHCKKCGKQGEMLQITFGGKTGDPVFNNPITTSTNFTIENEMAMNSNETTMTIDSSRIVESLTNLSSSINKL